MIPTNNSSNGLNALQFPQPAPPGADHLTDLLETASLVVESAIGLAEARLKDAYHKTPAIPGEVATLDNTCRGLYSARNGLQHAKRDYTMAKDFR